MRVFRRSWIVDLIGLLITTSLLLAACGGAATEAPPPTEAEMMAEEPTEAPMQEAELSGSITHMTWGGAYSEADSQAFLEPFTSEHGLDFQTVAAPAEMYARLKAMVDAGEVSVDTIDADALTAHQAWQEGLLEPLPADTKDVLIEACGADRVTDFGLAHELFADLIACNADVVEQCPTNPQEFWDVDGFPGPRMMGTSTWYHNLMFALMADGVPAEDLYPLDVDRAFAKLDEIKPHITVWYTSGDQSQQAFRDEEVAIAYMWDGRAWGLEDMGLENMQYSYDGASIGNTYYVVPKGAPNKDAGFAFIEWYATHPAAQAQWMEMIGYGTCNPEAYEFLDPEVAEQLVGAHPQSAPSDYGWIAEYGDEVKERWFTWLGE